MERDRRACSSLTHLVGDVNDSVRREQSLRVVGGLAVIAEVQQTLGAVEVGRLDALTTHARVAPVRRLADRLRHLAHAHRVAAAASVSGRRRRQGSDGRAVEGQAGHVPTGRAGDETARPTAALLRVVVGGSDGVETPVVGQTALTERVPTVQMTRRRRERRFQAEQTAELTARLRRLQFAVRRATARLPAAVRHVLARALGAGSASHPAPGHTHVSAPPRPRV